MAGDDLRLHDVPERVCNAALYRHNGGGPITFACFREYQRLHTLTFQGGTRMGIVDQEVDLIVDFFQVRHGYHRWVWDVRGGELESRMMLPGS